MCEPSHSITQYPDNDDRGPTGDRIGAVTQVREWFKKIGSWFHLSKLGFGHSESLRATSIQTSEIYLPNSALYEGDWWDRSLRADSSGRDGQWIHKEESAKEAAEEYYQRVCVGNIGIFRRFLENTLKNTWNPFNYLQMLPFKRETIGQIESKIKLHANGDRNRFVKIVMGYTRKRSLFLPVWADEPKIWTPEPGTWPKLSKGL